MINLAYTFDNLDFLLVRPNMHWDRLDFYTPNTHLSTLHDFFQGWHFRSIKEAVQNQVATLFMDKRQHSRHHPSRKMFYTGYLRERRSRSLGDNLLVVPHIDSDIPQLERDLNTPTTL